MLSRPIYFMDGIFLTQLFHQLLPTGYKDVISLCHAGELKGRTFEVCFHISCCAQHACTAALRLPCRCYAGGIAYISHGVYQHFRNLKPIYISRFTEKKHSESTFEKTFNFLLKISYRISPGNELTNAHIT